MALSADTRKLLQYPNLVLLMDISFRGDTGTMDSYLAEIYEESAKAINNHSPLWPTSNRPLPQQHLKNTF